MKKILVLGAGLVSRPLIKYLLDHPGFELTVASLDIVEDVKSLVEANPRGHIVRLDVSDEKKVEELVSAHDISVSLLPYTFHPMVAKMCIKHKKNMATASYVSPAMRALEKDVLDAGIIVLNELGVDPGIDHMSAMRVIHDVEKKGGRVVSFQSYCGGLPAPEADDNPFGYKFSWSPKGVLMAGKNNARYLEDGEIVEIEGKDLFDNSWTLEIGGNSLFEAYPNRDSLPYIDTYGLKNMKTMFRGTLRNLGWCAVLKKFADLNLLDDKADEKFSNNTYNEFMAKIIGKSGLKNIKDAVAEHLKVDSESPEINAMEWLGLFSDEKIPQDVNPAPIDIMTDLMLRKMSYNKGERDMIVLHHEFYAEYGDRAEEITSTLIDYGIPDGDSSMARTVSLPLAIAVKMVLEGEFAKPGIHIPVTPELYDPILKELETMNIKCIESSKPSTVYAK